MLRSHPPPLLHVSDLFKFGYEPSRRCLEANDEVQSVHSAADDESVASTELCSERSPSFDDCEDRPLNLSCKRRKVEEHPRDLTTRPKTSSSLSSSSGSSFHETAKKTTLDSLAGYPSSLYPYFPGDVMEKAILQYQAQMLASNDLVRAFLHQKWSETAASSLPLPPHISQKTTALDYSATQPWVPFLSGLRRPEAPQSGITASLPSDATNSHKPLRETKSNDSDSPRSRMYLSSPIRLSTPVLLSPPVSPHKDAIASAPRLSPHYSVGSVSPSASLTSPGYSASERSRDADVYSPDRQSVHSPANNEIHAESMLPSPNALKRRRTKRNSSGNGSTSGDTYPCSICGAAYPHKFELNRHVKVSHVRPHRCDQCGKGFGHRNYLKVHIETVHMGRKSHQCRLCGKYLSTGGNLNVHVRTIHLGEKKYNCPVCNRSFGQQCNMKTHMKRHFSKADDCTL